MITTFRFGSFDCPNEKNSSVEKSLMNLEIGAGVVDSMVMEWQHLFEYPGPFEHN